MTHSAWISLLVRLTLGPLFLAYGINKISSYAETAERISSGFAETWLPGFLVVPMSWLIPIWEFSLGVLLLTGFRYRQVLIACGLLIAMLTFGKAVQGASDIVARNLGFLTVILIGIWHADHNPFALGRRPS